LKEVCWPSRRTRPWSHSVGEPPRAKFIDVDTAVLVRIGFGKSDANGY
jgi:hypothetical protein